MKVGQVGEGKVYLLNKGGKVWTDIAARFVRSCLRMFRTGLKNAYSSQGCLNEHIQ